MKKVMRFTASWCQPCKSLAINLEAVKTEVPIEVVDIDVHTEFAMEHSIRTVPTLVMFHDGKETKRITGIKTTSQLTEWIND
jgi:thioredoxin-like negative regulator of GroEL